MKAFTVRPFGTKGGINFDDVLALWDGVKTEGLGGTYHMRAVAQQHGAGLVTIYTSDLLKTGSATTQAGG